MSDEEVKDDLEQLGEQVQDHDADPVGGDENTDQSDVTSEAETKTANLSPEVEAKLDRALNALEQASLRAAKTGKSEDLQEARRQQSRLQKLIESEDLDLDPAKALKDIGSEVIDFQKQAGETQRQYEARMARLEQQNAALSEQLYRSNFNQEHPDLKGRYDELVKQTAKDEDVQEALALARESNDPKVHAMAQRVWSKAWKQTIQEAQGKAQASGKEKPTAKKAPASVNPIASRGGNGNAGPTKSFFERIWGPDSKTKP